MEDEKLENENQVLCLVPENNVFLIDWLTVVFHDVSVPYVQALLGMDDPNIPWETERSFRHGYPCRTWYKNITILWGADDERFYDSDGKKSAADKVRHDMGICLDMSGQGCRQFESFPGNDWIKLLQDICDRPKISITRLDLAYDDHIGTLDLHKIALDVRDRNYTSPSKKSMIIWSDDQVNDVQGLTVSVGSKSSDVMVRIYDKAAEREFDDDRHWVRCEIQLRHDRCLPAVVQILDQNHVGRVAAGILRNYLMFRTPDTSDTNKSRWPVAVYWDKVLLDMDRVRLWISPGEPYNFSKTELHLIRQYGQALITVEALNGSLGSFLDACKRTYPNLSKKYQSVVDEFRHNKELARLEREKHPNLRFGSLVDLDGSYKEYWYAEDIFGDSVNLDL